MKLPGRVYRDLPDEAQLAGILDTLAGFSSGSTFPERITLYRLHVLCEVLYASGLRIAEAAALRCEDLDLERREIHLREGKGGIPRVVYLNEYAAEVLKLYIKHIKAPLTGGAAGPTATGVSDPGSSEIGSSAGGSPSGVDDPLFGIRNSTTLGQLVSRRLKEHKMSAHSFRHSLGYHLLRAECDLRYIQLILGHQDLQSTSIYTKVDKRSLKEQLDEHHPRG